MSIDISVIIPTYNRASDLYRTLEGMANCQRGNLRVEFVVVDNGSTDQTKQVVDSYSSRLATRYLFEARSGKSRALNTALETVELGDIVVFTDDDVDPSREWLVSIFSTCERWPQHSVFGGGIDISFPDEKVPKWALDPAISAGAFGYHNYCSHECIYENRLTPYGANFWLRKEVLGNGRRFSEAIGPYPNGMILGEDILFLARLLDDGFEIVYSPSAVVIHRVRPEMLNLHKIYRRAYQAGRGDTRVTSLPHLTLLGQSPTLWRLHRAGSIMLHTVRVLQSLFFSDKDQRPRNVVKNMRDIGFRVESFRLGQKALVKPSGHS